MGDFLPQVTLILPVYNERDNLAPLIDEIDHAFASVPCEVIAVDDASTDGSGAELERLAEDRPHVRVLTLERRSGQSAALAAGVDAARAPLVLTMDADGQNDPAEGRRVLDILRETARATAVVGVRTRRADGWWKRVQSRIGNAVRDIVTGDRVTDTGCTLKVMPRDALLRLPRFDGMHRFLPTLLRREGEHVLEVEVFHRSRRFGRSKYGAWRRMVAGLGDAFGVRWLRKRQLHYRVRKLD